MDISEEIELEGKNIENMNDSELLIFENKVIKGLLSNFNVRKEI